MNYVKKKLIINITRGGVIMIQLIIRLFHNKQFFGGGTGGGAGAGRKF